MSNMKYDDTDYLINREESIEYKISDTNVSSIEKDIKRCEQLIKPEHANWIGISNQLAIGHLIERIKELEDMLKEKDKEMEKKDEKLGILKQQYKNLENDFDSYKNNKDINYLDGIHHKKLVEKSIGQIINTPEECYFDIFEVKVIRNNILYGVAINEDFVSLKQISDENPEECITVIAESPLSGAIYRYNNYGDKKWQLIGTMLGYA